MSRVIQSTITGGCIYLDGGAGGVPSLQGFMSVAGSLPLPGWLQLVYSECTA